MKKLYNPQHRAVQPPYNTMNNNILSRSNYMCKIDNFRIAYRKNPYYLSPFILKIILYLLPQSFLDFY